MDSTPHHGRSACVIGPGIAALLGTAVVSAPMHAPAPTHEPMSVATPTPVGAPADGASWHFDDASTLAVLQHFAERGGFRLLVTDAVHGTLSLHLEDATWEQALDAVLRIAGLEQIVVDDTRLVSAGL